MATVIIREKLDDIRDNLLEIKGMLLGATYSTHQLDTDFYLDICERLDSILRLQEELR